MYDVQQPVTTMDWVDGKSLCIATSTGQKHELLELLLPDKMIEIEEHGKLKKDRDFRVTAGGFCQRKVTDLKHIPGTRLCVLSDTENKGITVWQIGSSDTDLMREVKSIPSKTQSGFPVRIAVAETPEVNTVTFGSALNSISVTDVSTCQVLRTIDNGSQKHEPLSSIDYRDNDTLISCSACSGAINILDLRLPEVKVKEVQCQGHLASFWTMNNVDSQSNDLFLLSSNGEVLLKDLRCLNENVERLQTSLCSSRNFENLSIQTGKTKDLFSVSGFDGNIYIFKNQATKCDTVEPLFQHEGHVMNQEDLSDSLLVVKHLWHPWQQDLVMSAATDGSLHAWQYQLSTS